MIILAHVETLKQEKEADQDGSHDLKFFVLRKLVNKRIGGCNETNNNRKVE